MSFQFSIFVTTKLESWDSSHIKLNFSSTLLRNAATTSQKENTSENKNSNSSLIIEEHYSHSSSRSMSNLQMAFYIAHAGHLILFKKNTNSECCSLLHDWYVYHITSATRTWVVYNGSDIDLAAEKQMCCCLTSFLEIFVYFYASFTWKKNPANKRKK